MVDKLGKGLQINFKEGLTKKITKIKGWIGEVLIGTTIFSGKNVLNKKDVFGATQGVPIGKVCFKTGWRKGPKKEFKGCYKRVWNILN